MNSISRVLVSLSVVLLLSILLFTPISAALTVSTTGGKLLVDGKPYFVRGVNYSPVPIGEDVLSGYPDGDYYTIDYAYIWQRDLPIIKAMGANTIRIYAWNSALDSNNNVTVNHRYFLDAVHSAGLKVLITFYVDNAVDYPINTVALQEKMITRFVSQVAAYSGHPALLGWIFGNELNGFWNGFMPAFSESHSCGWSAACNDRAQAAECIAPSDCLYKAFYGWLNKAFTEAKSVGGGILMTTGFADTDNVLDKIKKYSGLLSNMDMFSMQIYRGFSFGAYFDQYRTQVLQSAMPNRLLLVTEYGIDAYNDPCGWFENRDVTPCRNTPKDGYGGVSALPGQEYKGCTITSYSDNWNTYNFNCTKSGEQSQSEYDSNLAGELESHSFQLNNIKSPVVAGGFVMAYSDEYWKGGAHEGCNVPCKVDKFNTCLDSAPYLVPGGSAGCRSKAHITCSNFDPFYQDLCGSLLPSSNDGYSNEQWYGITIPTLCTGKQDINKRHTLNSILPRPAYRALQSLWGGSTLNEKWPSCADLDSCWSCNANKPYAEQLNGACKSVCPILAYSFPTTAAPTPAPTTAVPTSAPTSAPTTTAAPTTTPTSGATTVPTTTTPTPTNPTVITDAPTDSPINTPAPTDSDIITDSPTVAPTPSETTDPVGLNTRSSGNNNLILTNNQLLLVTIIAIICSILY